MTISSRGWFVVAGFAAVVIGVASLGFSPGMAAQSAGQSFTEASLGQSLRIAGPQNQKRQAPL